MKRFLSRLFKKLTKKLTKGTKALIFFSSAVLVALALILAYGYFTSKSASAAWFSEEWLYRKAIPIATHTASENNVYINLTGADDLDTSDTTRFQADCGDLRFTKKNGELLPYYISSGCGTADTVIQVNFDTFPAGAQTIYYYYGNTSADNGFSPSAFSTEASNYTLSTQGSEEQGKGPVGYWKFDDGQGQTVQDTSSSNNDGTLGADSGSSTDDPTWTTEDQCVAGKCLKFDGGDYIDAGSNTSLDNSSITVSAWIKPNAISSQLVNYFISKFTDDDGLNDQGWAFGFMGTHANCNGADGTPMVYETTSNTTVCASTVVTTNNWYHLVFTNDGTTTKIYVNGRLENSAAQTWTEAASSNLNIGRRSDGVWYTNGFIDEVKIYPYVRTAAEVKTDYLSGKAAAESKTGSSAVQGAKPQVFMSDGLVGYWKMDEASGTSAADSSGNSNTGTAADSISGNGDGNTPPPVTGTAKFGNGRDFDGTDDYITVNDSSTLDSMSSLTVSVWARLDTASGNRWLLYKRHGSSPWLSYNVGFNGTNFTFNVGNSSTTAGAVASSSVSADTWYHIVGTYDGAKVRIYVNAVDSDATPGSITGTILNSDSTLDFGGYWDNYYLDGKIDEIRIYNKALSPKEITDLYNWAPGPVVHLKMDEKTGTSANDTSGNARTGTLNGNPVWDAGKYGAGVKLDGTGDNISVDDFAY